MTILRDFCFLPRSELTSWFFMVFLVARNGKELNLLEIDMTQLVVSAASVSVDFLVGKQATCPILSWIFLRA